MFDSIDDHARQDKSSSKDKVMIALGVALISAVLFGGLYLTVS